MGCTQAQNVNRIQMTPLGQDSESLKQFYQMQKEQQELQQQFEGQGLSSTSIGSASSQKQASKIVRKDWARLKQTLAPKNSIQLVNCEALQPVLAKAVGNDEELRQRVIQLFLKQTKTPKSKISSHSAKSSQAGGSKEEHASQKKSTSDTDEVNYCINIAQEQLPYFRKKIKIAELCHYLSRTFGEILKVNQQLRQRVPKTEGAQDFSFNQASASPSLPLKWSESWYNRFSSVLLMELASFAPIFQLILKKGDTLLEKAQQSPETTYYYGCAMIVIRFLEGTSWGYSEMLMHQKLDNDTLVALRVCYNLLLRLKQGYREDKLIGPTFNKNEDVSAVYFPEPVFQRVYSHNQLDKLICMQSRDELEQLGDLKTTSQQDDTTGMFQYFDNQIFRKTYIAAKKEIDDWLRMPSYTKSQKQSTKNANEAVPLSKPVVERDDTEFVTQLQASSIRQNVKEAAARAGHAEGSHQSLNSDTINVEQYKKRQAIRTMTRDFIRQLKNPDLNLDGSLKPASDRKTTHHARNLQTLHYDQSDPFAMAQAQINKSAPESRLTQGADDGKPTFEIDNSRNVMLLVGAATDTRVILESFLQANVRMRSKYKCAVLHCCTRENRLTHDSYYIVKHIILQIVRTVPAVKNLLLLQKHDYFKEFLTSKASLNKQLKLQQEAPAMLVKFFKILQQVKLDFNICVFITGIENVFNMSDLHNIVYVIRSLTCNSLYMPHYMRFVLTAERREGKSKNFDLLVRLLQTKKVVDVHDHKFFESEGHSLVDFVFQYTQTLHSQSRLRMNQQTASGDGHDEDAVPVVAEATPEERNSVVEAVLAKAQQSYRVIIDIFSKLDLAGVYLIQVESALRAVQAYQSDHVRFLPQLEGMIKQDGNDRLLTRTILQVLTQTRGAISFQLFARICHCLIVAKQYIKSQGKDADEVANGTASKPVVDNEKNITVAGSKSISALIEKSSEMDSESYNVTSSHIRDLRNKMSRDYHDKTLQQDMNRRRNASESQPLGGKTQELPATSDMLQVPNNDTQVPEEAKEPPQAVAESGVKEGGKSLSPLKDQSRADTPFEKELQVPGDKEYTSLPAGDNKEEVKGNPEDKPAEAQPQRADIMAVMRHVLREANLEMALESDFVDLLMQKLISIAEFVHFVAKERITGQTSQARTHGGQESFNDGEPSASGSEEEAAAAQYTLLEDSIEDQGTLSKHIARNDALGILKYANNLKDSGKAQEARKLFSEVFSKLNIVPRKRKMIKACMSVMRVYKSRYLDAIIQLVALEEFGGKNPIKEEGSTWRQAAPYETIDPYLRLYIYHHWSKSEAKLRFTSFESLLTIENIFKQIVYFGSYERYRQNLRLIFQRPEIESSESAGITYLVNTLYLIQQTLKYEPINYLDFCTQMRGRTLGDASSKNLPDMKQSELLQNSGNLDVCYFENFHHSLRENPRIDLVVQFEGCQVLTLKFFTDKKRIMISLSNGLLLLYNTETNKVLKVYTQSHAVIDRIKIIDDRYIICAGIDPKQRIWNIENQRQVSKFEMHGYCTSQIVIYKEFLITYGYSRSLVKFNFMKKQHQCWIETASYLTNLKLLKTNDKSHPVKLIASFTDGDIVLYSIDLSVLCHINRSVQEPVLRIICLSHSESLCFYRDGQISVMSGIILEETKAGSIFSLKSDDYIDMILIKSREYFLFTIEKQKIEFFNANTFKRSDSWDYFFERDIVGCDKNKEGSKICVWDKGGYLTLFNFLKHLDNSQKQYNTPSHRRYDPVVCIDVTERLGDKNQVISCSLERDLRVWSRDTGQFLKKYDLSSFTAENVSTIRLGKSEGMLFLGSKDMNVYLIDVARGKLCVVYEGHWSRVTSIYTLPGRDVLVTLSESNIKVWDLEYDECIKNMNDHSSLIVYCAVSHENEERIVTISQNLEYKEWSYVTGDIFKQFVIDLSSVRDSADDSEEEASSGREEEGSESEGGGDGDGEGESSEPSGSSGSEKSRGGSNPQGDDQAPNTFSVQLDKLTLDDKTQPSKSDASRVPLLAEDRRKKARLRRHKKGKAHQPERKPKNLVACHVSAQGFAYLAIDSNKIIVYNLITKEVYSVFESYQCQTVIYLTSIETARSDYLIVVTRTSCVLYSILEDGVRRMTSYLINSRKRPYRSLDENRFSYSVRFYFTAAKVIRAQDEEPSQADTAGLLSQQRSSGEQKKEKRGGVGLLGSDFNMAQAPDAAVSESAFEYLQGGIRTPEMLVLNDDASAPDLQMSMRWSIGAASSSMQALAQNHARTYKHAIDSLSQSPLPEHRDLAVSLQRNSNMWNYHSQPGLQAQNQLGSNQNLIPPRQGAESVLSDNAFQLYESAQAAQSMPFLTNPLQAAAHETTSMAAMTEWRKREKYLVYLGDSRGQVHMTSLYLPGV